VLRYTLGQEKELAMPEFVSKKDFEVSLQDFSKDIHNELNKVETNLTRELCTIQGNMDGMQGEVHMVQGGVQDIKRDLLFINGRLDRMDSMFAALFAHLGIQLPKL
jgi:hypothetical protein